jgi:uncharacterized protein
VYCFEERKEISMKRDVEDALIYFVDKKLDKVKNFSITWFGGEPLLRLDIIERLSSAFNQLCEKKKIEFSFQQIITNGYLLTKVNAEKLKNLNIKSIQITIDGPPAIHNARRQLKNGEGTFDRIVNNIREPADFLDIIIRINIDEENFNNIDELYEILEKSGILNRVLIYIGHVRASTAACSSVSYKCFNVKSFSKIVIDFFKQNKKAKLAPIYPKLYDYGVCCADKINAFVVAPSGNLYKCWSEISFNEKNSIGNVFNDELKPYQIKNLVKYMNWDPFLIKECIRCKYLPICAGGCPFFDLNSIEKCTAWKYYLKEMMKLKYEQIVLLKK